MEARISGSSENGRYPVGDRRNTALSRGHDSVYSSTDRGGRPVCFMRPSGVGVAGDGARAGSSASAGLPQPALVAARPIISPPVESVPFTPTPRAAPSLTAAILPATRLAIVPLCVDDTVQSLALAIGVADRLAVLTDRPGAIVTANSEVARLVRNARRRTRGVRLDGFEVLARRGGVSLIGAEDAGAASIAISAQLPLVSLVAADELMDAALAEIRPGVLLLVDGEQTGARYLELALRDLTARLPAARVLCAGIGERDSGVPRDLTLLADASTALRLRLGIRASPATRTNAERLALSALERRST